MLSYVLLYSSVSLGHWHCYERIHPVTHGNVNVYPTKKRTVDYYYSDGMGPVQVVQGNSGAMQVETWHQPQPDWSAKRFAEGLVGRNRSSVDVFGESITDVHSEGYILPHSNYTDTYGFGVITAYNSSYLKYEAVANTDGTVGTDTFWIVKRLV